jgi:hypothetical protein
MQDVIHDLVSLLYLRPYTAAGLPRKRSDSRLLLCLFNGLGLRTFRTWFRHEIDPVAFTQNTANDFALMDENVFAAVSSGDEPKALCGVKPFHRSLHIVLL